ncbi:MAG: sigma-70 family RNA polymerase sigma factor [Dysgonamonadaceae bacterium]|jgi:RNA polymerase sigma-70 factor (ECF subfamily)|nr:sigma-70 family RNA polymerase sigma factor [Dysgonamonadaceae bacterium]
MQDDTLKKKVFLELFEVYSKKLYETACRHVPASDAEDIVQELFLEIWEKREEIKVKESWDKYLYAVLKYRIIRFLNAKNEMEESLREALQEMGSRDKILSFEQLYKKMDAAIERLPNSRKTILKKRYFENMKIKDIAEELSISPETVKQQLKRAKALLQRELREGLANFLF